MSSSGFFRARIIVEDDDTQEIETIWDDELTPFEGGKRSIREWVKEHFDCYNGERLRDLLGLPATGNFEVVIEAVISGYQVGYEAPEWDEDIEIKSIKTQPIPDSFYEDLDEKHKGLDDSDRE